jgi:hypothetical protein
MTTLWLRRLISPLQGLAIFWVGNPGRCPGLTYFAPLGLKAANSAQGLRRLPNLYANLYK